MQRILMLVGISTVMHFALVSGILDPEVRRLSGGDPAPPDCDGRMEVTFCPQNPQSIYDCIDFEQIFYHIKECNNDCLFKGQPTGPVCRQTGCLSYIDALAEYGCNKR